MAIIARDPLDFWPEGVWSASLVITLSHPAPLVYTAYDASLGGWQAGFAGTVTADGAGGFDIAITGHPALLGGVWTVTVAASNFAGLPGGGFWSFTVNAPPVVTGTGPAPGAIGVLPTAPIEFNSTDDVAVNPATQALTLTPPVGAPWSGLVAGAWAAGWGGPITANAGNGYDVSAPTHPPFYPPGLWTALAECDDFDPLHGSDTWTWTVPALNVLRAWQTSLNTVDVQFDHEPTHLDPANPHDGTYLAAYTVVGPVAPLPARLLHVVTYEGSNTLRLWFDGSLVEGETYQITITAGLEAVDGVALYPDYTFSFVAFGESHPTIPVRYETADAWDLKNPQVARDAGAGESLGTLQVDEEGDLAVETRRSSLRKRVIRRFTTAPGGFAHLTDYGLRIDEKKLLRPAELRRLKADAEAQIAREPDVVSVRVSISQPTPGVVWARVRVIDRYGQLEIEATIGSGG